VALAHILAGRAQEESTHHAALNKLGLAAWLCGTLAGFVLMEMTGFWSSLSAPLSFVVSMAVYAGGQLRGRAAQVVTAGE
jgi:hypothetical protein